LRKHSTLYYAINLSQGRTSKDPALGLACTHKRFIMKRDKAFTIVELMVVVLIVGILAAVAVPIIRGRIDSAKWTEGKAGCGSIGYGLRAYAAEKGTEGTYPPTLSTLGLTASDLHGKYFTIGNYSILACSYNEGADPELIFVIQCDNTGTSISMPSAMQLDETGNWIEVP